MILCSDWLRKIEICAIEEFLNRGKTCYETYTYGDLFVLSKRYHIVAYGLKLRGITLSQANVCYPSNLHHDLHVYNIIHSSKTMIFDAIDYR